MRLSIKGAIVSSLILGLLLLCDSRAGFKPPAPEVLPPVTGPARESNAMPPCQFPALAEGSTDQTAWRVFVAATCPAVSNARDAVAWEDWPLQHEASTAPAGKLMRVGASTSEMASSGAEPPWRCELKSSGRTICEEVRVNPAMAVWLGDLGGAGAFESGFLPAAAKDFGSPLIEVKAHWIRLPTCANKPQAAHVEQRESTCYELGGMEVIAELFDRWVSASFEAQDLPSNPGRCRGTGCSDAWGSYPAVSHGGAGGNTRLSPALSSLMQQANLTSEWLNYRLDEARSNAVDGVGGVVAPLAGDAANQTLSVASSEVPEGVGPAESKLGPGPIPIADDTLVRRSSISTLGTGCSGEGLGRNCPVSAMVKKGKVKRPT